MGPPIRVNSTLLCIDPQKKCDGHKDCTTNLDEAHCVGTSAMNYAIRPPAVVHFDRPGGFTVTALLEEAPCPNTHFQCSDGGYCLPVYVRCNRVNDCPDREDELECDEFTCPGFFRCRDIDRTLCLHVSHLCDGWPQCPRHDDELMCDLTCPDSCTCYGLAFTCTGTFQASSFPYLRYLEARGSGMYQSDVTNNIMLIHLGFQACGWSNLTDFKLPNLQSLDLSDNLLRVFNFSHFVGMYHLRRLNLAGNPITSSLSTVEWKIGSLAHETKPSQGQPPFKNLRVLDLRGCPLSVFNPDFMKGMVSLMLVYADDFKLCCSAVLPNFFRGECLAPSEEISSCGDLLKSSVYRSALAGFALLALFGNTYSFVYRLCFSSEKVIGFIVFVLHLCASDFLMGVYLAFIGVADQVYSGVYVWNETAWQKSLFCSVAGILAFVSSEVSAFLICVITLDRFLVLHFPWSQVRFHVFSANVTCVGIWILGLSLATVPLLPVATHWNFYRQTGLCIPLPVTRADFPGHVYSFSIIIVLNLVLFLLIAAGQSLIYWSVRANAMPQHGTETVDQQRETVKSREAAIARRLLSIALSDFLCWFPVGLCGLLAAINVTIPGEVNAAMAIFVLPLNSALNPFLYTLNMALEKRRKARELRFHKFIHAHLKENSVRTSTALK